MLRRVLLSLSTQLLIVLGLLAQPEERMTCHIHHSRVKPATLTAAEKALLNDSYLRSDTFDIIHYELFIDVTDYFGQTIDGRAILTIEPLMDDLMDIRLDLKDLVVEEVLVDGTDATFIQEDEILTIDFPSASQSGVLMDLDITYGGEPYQDPQWGGFYFEANYAYNLGIGLSTIPPNFGRVWYPCFDTFRERATYDFHVTAADGRIPECQGELISETALGGDTIQRHFRMEIPICTYQTAIAAADYVTIAYDHEGLEQTIPVEIHAKTGQQNAMETRFERFPGIIDALEHWFGPYIWNKAGYNMTTVGAMEHPTNIAYPQSMMSASVLSNEGLIAHEFGHMWWGNITAPSIHNEMWIKEGGAEYSQHLAREWLDGHEEFIDEVKANHLYVLETAHVDDEGFWPLSQIPDPHIYGRHSYYKGASVWHNMRGYLGDSLFRAGSQAVLDTFFLASMDPAQFESALSNSTGVDMSDFFDDQILQPGFSNFILDSTSVEEVDGEFQVTCYVRQKVRAADHLYNNVPLDVTLLDSGWQKHSFTALASGASDVLTVIAPFEPQLIMLNAEGRLNQARMDHDRVLFEETNLVLLPWVDFRMKVEGIQDTAYFRAEHHWVSPDDFFLGSDVDEISSTHYYSVGGVWSEGLSLSGRFTYNGVDETDLDHDLVGETEEGIVLLYRQDVTQDWTVYPYQTLSGGSDNGSGSIKADSLIAGEYCFGKGELPVGLDEELESIEYFHAYPNPSDGRFLITTDEPGRYLMRVYDLNGRVVLERTEVLDREQVQVLDLEGEAAGRYQVEFIGMNGKQVGSLPLFLTGQGK